MSFFFFPAQTNHKMKTNHMKIKLDFVAAISDHGENKKIYNKHKPMKNRQNC